MIDPEKRGNDDHPLDTFKSFLSTLTEQPDPKHDTCVAVVD